MFNYRKTTLALAAIMASGGVIAAEAQREFHWSIDTGLGYESNVFRAPDHSYADYYADPTGATIVSPSEQGSFYVPLKVKAEMSQALDERTTLLADYRLGSSFYLGAADANYTDHDISIGAERVLNAKRRKRESVYGGIFISSHNEVYTDRDTGDPKTSTLTGADVSNRYTYKSFGLEGRYERAIRGYQLGVDFLYETLDYNDPVVWSQYDHSHTLLGFDVERRLAKPTKLKLAYSYELRDYTDRHAYNANGSLLAGNPFLIYTYNTFDVTVRHRLNEKSVLYAGYNLLMRSDNHVGYNDLNQSELSARLIHQYSERLRLRGKLAYTSSDYPNAFNFEDPARGGKSASGMDLQAKAEYSWHKHKTYSVSFDYKTRDNSDDRYSYNDIRIMLGAGWEY